MNGKILIILLFIVNLFAVTASVDKQNVIEGDNVSFSITASGSNVKFPNIQNIDGDNIDAISSSQNISIINGNYQKTITKTYSFSPSHSLVIPSYKVSVNGKTELTKPIKIKVVKDTKFNKDFKLKIFTKKDAIVGYPHQLTIKFYQKTDVKIGSISLELPKGNFKLKQIGKEKNYFEGVYRVAEIKYNLIPLKQGKIDLKVRLKLGFVKQQIDNFGFIMNGMRYKTISKTANIEAKKVYNGLIGNFHISLNVDKTKVDANTPVNATLFIKGDGDLSQLGDIKFNIPNVTMYDNKAKIKDNKYQKTYVLVADRNYTIPPLSLSFYNLKDKKVKTISTKPILITVNKSSASMPLSINHQQKCICPKAKTITKIEHKNSYFLAIIMFFVGGLIGYLLKFIKFKKVELPKNLYNKLLPFADNPKIKEILNKLYKKENLSKDEKEFLKGFFKDNI